MKRASRFLHIVFVALAVDAGRDIGLLEIAMHTWPVI
jgi:hypothetical protein